ncbi:MAG: XRE family transcriptional regulator [Chloroflexi bacterium]|nr:XRE family transcriptional regulator [Chloroflexota bacterium]
MSDIVSFGEWVQKRRNQLGLSRPALARQMGCAPVTIKKIERDERRPSLQIAELLAQHLQIPETEQGDFIRRARGEFVARFGSPAEMSLAEAQATVAAEDEPKHNLPLQTTPFIGREDELAEIVSNLADSNCRLLTILGAGGMGKTRLSIEAAAVQVENFTDGITYVALAPISAADSEDRLNPLLGALADALKISFHGKDTPERQLLSYLRRKEMLIVFDNFEHLLETAPAPSRGQAVLVANLLSHAPDIKILITSRARLQLQEEWILNLQGLPFPNTLTNELENEPLNYSAVALFTQRAKQLKSTFDVEAELTAVYRICQLVEGMPLALELAAAWVRQLPCEVIVQEIEAEIDFLATNLRNMPDRHRSVRAVFAYSWQQLSADEKAVLQKLSVFRGGFEREAAKAVAKASLQLLAGLVDKSLLSVEDNSLSPRRSGGRYQLHELLRQFAAEKLAQTAADETEACAQHGRYFLAFVAQQEQKITGAGALIAIRGIERDIDNVRTAIHWGIAHQPQLFNKPFGLALWQFYEVLGWHLESEAIFRLISAKLKEQCLSNYMEEDEPTVSLECILWAQYHANLGLCQWRFARFEEAEETLQQSLLLLAKEDPAAQWARGLSLLGLGLVAYFKNDLARAHIILKECSELAKKAGDSYLSGVSFMSRCQVAHLSGKYDEAQRLAETAAEFLNASGDRISSCYVLSDLGRLAAIRGDFVQAEAYQQDCLRRRTELGTRTGIVFTLRDLGEIARLQGEYEAARNYIQQSIAMANEINMSYNAANSLWSLGSLAVAEGDFRRAKRYYQESLTIFPTQRFVGGPGWAALGLSEITEAKQLFQARLKITLNTQAKPAGLDALVGMAHVKAHNGQFSRALELLALVQQHSASSYEIKEKARQLWEELTAELPPELIAKAETRGRELELWETAEVLLME